MLLDENQWGDYKTIRHTHGRKYESEAGKMIRNIANLPLMVQFKMDSKIHMYVAISLERQPQK